MSKDNPKKRPARQNSVPSKPESPNPASGPQDREDTFLTDKEIDKLTVATAAGRSMDSQLFREQDVEQVVDWARGARIGSAMLGLVLTGKLLPMGVKDDGEIGFSTIDGGLSRKDAKAYRTKLARLLVGWTLTPPLEFMISGDDDLEFILAEPEKASLRLAVQTGNKCFENADLDEARMLQWAGEKRNDEILLSSIAVGDVVPIVMGKGCHLAFRSSEDLPAAERQEHRAKLRRIGDKYQS